MNRKRFWAGEMDDDKLSAYQTLYTCLVTISQLMAPIAPFYSDELYKDLTAPTGNIQSVHLTDFPVCDESLIDKDLETRMEMAQKITSMVLSLRKKEHIIVRQPLQKISIPALNQEQKEAVEAVKQLILDEVNVKDLEFVEGSMLEKTVKCNFRVMGKKFGKQMKAVSAAVANMSQAEIATLESEGNILLPLGKESALIELQDVEIISEDIPGWTVANDGSLTVALDLELTEELRQEGIAREIVKRIQAYRKDSGFEITDHIKVAFRDEPILKKVLNKYADYIAGQVLADALTVSPSVDGFLLELDMLKVIMNIDKA